MPGALVPAHRLPDNRNLSPLVESPDDGSGFGRRRVNGSEVLGDTGSPGRRRAGQGRKLLAGVQARRRELGKEVEEEHIGDRVGAGFVRARCLARRAGRPPGSGHRCAAYRRHQKGGTGDEQH